MLASVLWVFVGCASEYELTSHAKQTNGCSPKGQHFDVIAVGCIPLSPRTVFSLESLIKAADRFLCVDQMTIEQAGIALEAFNARFGESAAATRAFSVHGEPTLPLLETLPPGGNYASLVGSYVEGLQQVPTRSGAPPEFALGTSIEAFLAQHAENPPRDVAFVIIGPNPSWMGGAARRDPQVPDAPGATLLDHIPQLLYSGSNNVVHLVTEVFPPSPEGDKAATAWATSVSEQIMAVNKVTSMPKPRVVGTPPAPFGTTLWRPSSQQPDLEFFVDATPFHHIPDDASSQQEPISMPLLRLSYLAP